MAESSNLASPPSYLNDRKRERRSSPEMEASSKRRKIDSIVSAEARSIVNQKMRPSPRRLPRAEKVPAGLVPFEDDSLPIEADAAAAAEAAAFASRPFDPPAALNDIAPAFVPSCFEEEEWMQKYEMEEAVEKEETGRRPFCYLCKFGQEPGDEETQPYIPKMYEAWQTNYGVIADIELAELIHDIYPKHCQKHIEAGPTWDARPEWSVYTIFKHFTEHPGSDASFNRWSMTQCQRILRTVAKTGLVERETATGRRVINPKGVKLFLDVHKRLQSISSTASVTGSGGGGAGAGAPLTSSRSSARGT